jgi:alkylhydroperoxidase/carboxymuconolactone decarboxylase family protein YurZ
MKHFITVQSCILKKLNFWALLTLIFTIATINDMNAQQTNQQLDPKEQSIITIAAFTANGDLEKLKSALNSGLDAGLTINEIKEILIQLYAYCGFPRSLNGISTFMAVLDERTAKGIQEKVGAEPARVEGGDKYEQGRKTLEELSGIPQSGPLTGANAFAPGIDVFLKEHLFADIFGRGVLTYQQRELATITVLATLPGLESQLQYHIGVGLHVGLTQGQLQNIFSILEKNISKTQAEAARTVLSRVVEAKH